MHMDLFCCVLFLSYNQLFWMHVTYLSTPFEILHGARQYHCCALCKLSKPFGHWEINYRKFTPRDWYAIRTDILTENKISSIWRLCRHLWHRKLSYWQLSVPLVTTKLSNWRSFVFNDTVSSPLVPCLYLGLRRTPRLGNFCQSWYKYSSRLVGYWGTWMARVNAS